MIAFTFVQSTPATVWNVTHSFNGYPPCDVVVLDSGQYEKILPASVKYTGLNTVQVTFSQPRTGTVRIISLATPSGGGAGSIDPPQIDAEVGSFDNITSSPNPPPPTVLNSARTFATTPTALELFDNFVIGTNLNLRSVEEWAPSVTYPAPDTAYAWNDTGNTAVISAGSLALVPTNQPIVASPDEYDMMAEGMFIRTRFNATTSSRKFLVGLNFGFTELVLEAGTAASGYVGSIKVEVVGFNGAVDGIDGSLLPLDPLDPNGHTSASYTTDRFYTAAGDWRNKELKLSITTAAMVSQVILRADGDIVLRKNTRFPVQLFASSVFGDGSGHFYSEASAAFRMLNSNADNVEVQYVEVGTLGTSTSIPVPP